MRLLVLIALILFSLPAPAAAGSFWPSAENLTEEPDPGETLRAPFADAPRRGAAPDLNDESDLPAHNVPLYKPHRSLIDMERWIGMTLARSLTFNASDYPALLEDIVLDFDQNGFIDYQRFLDQEQILKMLQDGNFQLNTVIEARPFLLNESAAGGVYRWLYEVPVMLSFVDRSLRTYQGQLPQSKRFVILVQIKRTPPGDVMNDVVIEQWKARRAR